MRARTTLPATATHIGRAHRERDGKRTNIVLFCSISTTSLANEIRSPGRPPAPQFNVGGPPPAVQRCPRERAEKIRTPRARRGGGEPNIELGGGGIQQYARATKVTGFHW